MYLKSTKIAIVGLQSDMQHIILPPHTVLQDIRLEGLRNLGIERLLEYLETQSSEILGENLSREHDCYVHGEAAVAAYLFCQSRGKTVVPSIRYIGLSKAPCTACRELLASLEPHGALFKTQGSKEKTCFPWKYPDAALRGIPSKMKENIADTFIQGVAEEYNRRLRYMTCNFMFRSQFSDSYMEILEKKRMELKLKRLAERKEDSKARELSDLFIQVKGT